MRKEYFGRFNFRLPELERFQPPEVGESCGGMVTVGGKEVKQAWYGDTSEGIVRSYAVLPDGKARATRDLTPDDFPGREVECPINGVLSEVLRGNVRIFGLEMK